MTIEDETLPSWRKQERFCLGLEGGVSRSETIQSPGLNRNARWLRLGDSLNLVNRSCATSFVPGVSAALLCLSLAFASGSDAIQKSEISAESRALHLKDVDGKTYKPLAQTGQKATLFFFLLHDCPLANTCAPEVGRIVTEYRERGVVSFVVYAEPDLSARLARKHAREHKFPCPVLLDQSGRLVRLTGATVSPEAVVLGPGNHLLYRGRIDDRMTAFGKQRVEPAHRDLREALDAVLAGKPVTTPVTKAIGCYLPTPRSVSSDK